MRLTEGRSRRLFGLMTFGRRVVVAGLLGAAAWMPSRAVAQRRPVVSTIQVSPSDGQVDVGKTAAFFATAYDNANNAIASVTTFRWTSSNPRAATVDQNGIATGVGPGVAIITARYGVGRREKSGTATLQIMPPAGGGAAPQPQALAPAAAQPAETVPATHVAGLGCAAIERQPAGSGPAAGLVLTPLQLHLVKGESHQLGFRAVKDDNSNAAPVCIVFAVEQGGQQIVQVDSFGMVTSVGDTGRAMLRVTVPSKTNWPPRQVAVDVQADSVVFDQPEVSLAPGTVDTLALVVPAQGGRALGMTGIFQFNTSDSTKVKVSAIQPIVTAVAPGTARISASSSLYPDIHAIVNVHKPIRRLIGDPLDTLITLAIGSTIKVGYQFLAADSTPVTNVPVRWGLPDSTVAVLDTATLTLRGVKMGDTRIRLAAMADRTDSIYRSWHVRVVAGGLQIATARFALGVGQRAPLGVQLLDDQRQPLGPATGLTWSSSDSSVATVDSGTVVAVGMGHARLVATASWDSTAAAGVYVSGDMLLTARRGGQWNLYMADRSNLQRVLALTQDSALESGGAWSPGLTRIAYLRSPNPRSAVTDLWIANADGSDARKLTDDSATVRSPSFVPPAGDSLVFESSRGGKAHLYVIAANGSGRRGLTSGDTPSLQPDVSPDGKQVLFVSPKSGHYEVYLMNLDGTGLRQVTTSDRPDDSPAWASDGKAFYFLRDEGGKPATKRVYRQDLTTGLAAPLTPAGVFVQAFSVDAGGRTLALTVLRANPDGSSSAQTELFDVATGAMQPLVIPGLDPVGGVTFRPAVPRLPEAAPAAPAPAKTPPPAEVSAPPGA